MSDMRRDEGYEEGAQGTRRKNRRACFPDDRKGCISRRKTCLSAPDASEVR